METIVHESKGLHGTQSSNVGGKTSSQSIALQINVHQISREV